MLNSQTAFTGGLDFLSSDVQIANTAYQWLVNARQRFGYIQANKASINKSAFLPAGNLQGLVAVGNTLVLFVNGNAYYQFDGQTFWAQVAGFKLDATVSQYYSVFIPDSTFNFSRALNPTKNIADLIIKNANVSINGTPEGLLVQDGINQPMIITFDPATNIPSARATQTFAQWVNDGVHQEYVPIGTIMVYIAPKLLIVSPDFKVVYHSISGRPLDFMINVDTKGNKLANESAGGAFTVSFAFDFDEITCLAGANVPSSFFIASRTTSRIISYDFTNTVFGEPNYIVSVGPLAIGAVNRFSFLDILGDYSIVDAEGIKSFNAVQQYKMQGKNSIFSLKLQKLLQTDPNNVIQQQTPNCIMFNDCAIYSVKTVFGNILVVFDTILNQWVSLDINPCSKVKQFALINVNGIDKKLYAITYFNELFQLYADTSDECATLLTRAFTYVPSIAAAYQGTNVAVSFKQATEYLKILFDGGSYKTTVNVAEYVDGAFSQELAKDLQPRLAGVSPPIQPPVIPGSQETMVPLTFTLTEGKSGNKIAYSISWQSDARLISFETNTKDNLPIAGNVQNEAQLTH